MATSERDEIINGGILPKTAAVFRKKGAVNTPSEIIFFMKENGSLMFFIKAAAQLCYLYLTARNKLPNDGFFYLLSRAGATSFILLTIQVFL